MHYASLFVIHKTEMKNKWMIIPSQVDIALQVINVHVDRIVLRLLNMVSLKLYNQTEEQILLLICFLK